MVGVIGDPLILYYGGNRYDQPNHLLYKMCMANAMAYFTYDGIIEIYYNTADTITNVHHLFVVFGSIPQWLNKFCGYEYVLMHLVAEASNPFLIVRTILKI